MTKEHTAGRYATTGEVETPDVRQGRIEVIGVEKFYHKADKKQLNFLHVLNDINLTVAAGEFVSLLGPSGCGKTTLLKCVDGLIPIDAGEIRVSGQLITGPGRDRAVVFQNFGLLPWRSVLGNVTLPLEAAGQDRRSRENVARRFIDMVGLTKFTERHPHELSGGMQQRVGLARALAIDPKILLMDEPFGALDAQTRELMQIELLQIWQDMGKSVVFVTHSVDEAIFLSQRIVVMSTGPGRIIEILDVPFPYPRSEEIKLEQAYADMRHKLWATLSVARSSAFTE